MTRTTLVIQHQRAHMDSFVVTRQNYGSPSHSISVPSPYSVAVEGRPGSNLMQELRWYLESFLEYPFPPETGHALNVMKALRTWGQCVLETLLQADATCHADVQRDHVDLTLQVVSDSPTVLSWPWEALSYARGDAIEDTCQIHRRLNSTIAPMPVSADLPGDRLHILLVVARPYDLQDVGYRSIARSLVHHCSSSARVDVLRPPTIDQLRHHLSAHPNYYHILHFDGHGSYTRSADSPKGASTGHLVFERTDGGPDLVPAARLSEILRGSGLPSVVLNACQSARIGPEADTVFASVAAALLGAGIRAVVAMSYSLYVSGAQEFFPAFYRALLDAGAIAEAVRAGRHEMRAQPLRVCARGRFELEDWILPVLYQQAPLDFSFTIQPGPIVTKRESHLPEIVYPDNSPSSFVGRDGSVLLLERALHRTTPAVLVRGLAGVGKTTLVRGFLRWLDETNGLKSTALWFDFREIHSAEYVLNQVGERFFGDNFGAAPLDQKIRDLAVALGRDGIIIVWDNCESASGIAGTTRTPNLSEHDRSVLARFLDLLRGGATRVLITSRSEEGWINPDCRSLLHLGGLEGEERWEYCELVLRQLGMTIDRDDPELVRLINQLGGHPLTMRVILPQLRHHSAEWINDALKTNLANLQAGTGDDAQLFSSLRFIEFGLPANLHPLLIPMALHESYVDPNLVGWMAEQVPVPGASSQIGELAKILATAGLLRDVGPALEIHPALTGYLKSLLTSPTLSDSRDVWRRAFVDVMSRVADKFGSSAMPERRTLFRLHGGNFYAALEEAQLLGMTIAYEALANSLAIWSFHNRFLDEAERLYTLLASHQEMAGQAYHQLGVLAEAKGDAAGAETYYRKSLKIEEGAGNQRGQFKTYHQLGRLAQSRRDFIAAEDWYLKSLRLQNKINDEGGGAATYQQLGVLALERRDLKAAEEWYRKCLSILSRLKNEPAMSRLYHDLGRLAQERRNFAEARSRFRKAIELKVKVGDEHGSASSHNQLGRVALDTGDLASAYQSYRNAVNIWERFGDRPDAAIGYHSLGIIATERGDLTAAQEWFLKSLAIDEEIGNEQGAAITYHGLGRVAQERKEFATAEEWYLKSLAIKERSGNEHGKANTYSQLGLLESDRGRFIEAGRWLIRALQVFRIDDPRSEDTAARAYLLAHYHAAAAERLQLEGLWSDAHFGPFPEYRISGEENSR